MTLRRLVLALSLALALPTPAFAADLPATAPAASTVSPANAVSAADAAFARPLLDAFNSHDAERLAAIVDIDALVERVLEGSDFPDRTQREIREGVVAARAALGRNLAASLAQGHVEARLMRVTPRAGNDGYDVLVRHDIRDAAGAFAGVDYLLADVGPDGRMRDWYSYAQGDRTSATMRRLMGLMLEGDGGNMVARALGVEQVDQSLVLAMRRVGAARAQGDLPAALAALDGMQGPVRETRLWAVLRVLHASPDDQAKHAAVLADLHRGYGDDPEMQLLLLDHYFYTGDFAAMIEAIEGFERAVVEDEVTNRFKCMGAVNGKLWAAAELSCSRSIELAPEVEDVWWFLLTARSGARDVDALTAAIEAFERQFGTVLDIDQLLGHADYRWLADERAFQRWARARAR